MDESALLEIINSLRNQIADIKGKMQEHQREIDEIEAAHENEKNLIETKHQEEVEGIQYVISQQKNELESLKNDFTKNVDKIKDLETKLISKDGELDQKTHELKTKTKEYDFLKEHFDEKVEEIRQLNDKLIKKEEEYDNYVKEGSLPFYDKGDYNKVKIVDNKMSEDQKNFAINITRKSLNTYSDHFTRAKYIKEQFENKYGGTWCAVLITRGCGNCCVSYYDDCYISFDMGEFNVKIEKTNLGKDQIRLKDRGNYGRVYIVNNQMSEDQKNFAINITRKSLNTYNNHFECAKYIKEQFENKYGGTWCAILITRGCGNCCVSYYDSCYISFDMGEFNVKIEKTNH